MTGKDKFLIIPLVTLLAFARAQGPTKPFTIHQLDKSKGLSSQNYNLNIFKDSKGFVWISSLSGLNRYDGIEVKSYTHITDDSTSLADNHIYSKFFEDENSDIWFTSLTALHKYNRRFDNFTRFKLGQIAKNGSKEFQLMHFDRKSKSLWLANQNTLYLISTQSQEKIRNLGTFNLTYRSDIYPTGQSGIVYLIMPIKDGFEARKISETKGTLDSLFLTIDINKPLFGTSSLYESDSVCWIGTTAGLYCWDLSKNPSHPTSITKEPLLEGFTINDIKSIDQNKLIVATKNKGLYIINKHSLQIVGKIYTKDQKEIFPFDVEIDRIYIDNSFNVWLSPYLGNGVFIFNLKKRKFSISLPLPSAINNKANFIHSLSSSKKSKSSLYALSRYGLFLLDIDNQKWRENAFFNKDLKDIDNFHLSIDSKDRIWVCNMDGLYMAPSFNLPFGKIKKKGEEKIIGFTYLKELRNGRILASSQGAGILEVDESQDKTISLKSIKIKPNIKRFGKIFEDSNGKIYLCGNANSVFVYEQKKGNLVLTDSITFNILPQINSILEDTLSRTLWLGTSNGLFSIYNHEYQKPFYHKKLEQIDIKGLLQDKNGDLWLSTNNGIFQYQPKPSGSLINYNKSDGLLDLEFNHWSYTQIDSLFFFGGRNGVSFFNPNKISPLTIKPNSIISRIFVNDESKVRKNLICETTGNSNLTEILHLEFPYNERTLSFTFAPLEYSAPGENTYKFYMEGVDEKPVFSGTNKFTRYPNLPIGTHTLVVDASNSDGIFSEQPKRLKVTILPPWYLTNLAIFLWIILGISIIWGIIWIRLNRLKLDKQLAESETAVLRLQMNPHFIFNSLNSIRSYIRLQDIKSADTYLEQFSVLIRKILDSSEKSYSTLYEEKELIEDYIQAESMRFEKSFDFDFFIDSQLDPDDVLLPTMILQPFVENAIWHGLLPKKEKGKIQVNAIKGEEGLIISIQDNGVGREFHKGRTKTHESKGLEITQRRLALLSKKHSYPNSIKIVDLHDPDGNPVGTEVIIRIPLI